MKATLAALILFLAFPASALTPDQLTPAEKKVYDGLASTKASAAKYLAARDYLRKCDAVLADRTKAASLPKEPSGDYFRYLSFDEGDRVDEATGLQTAALLHPGEKPAPARAAP